MQNLKIVLSKLESLVWFGVFFFCCIAAYYGIDGKRWSDDVFAAWVILSGMGWFNWKFYRRQYKKQQERDKKEKDKTKIKNGEQKTRATHRRYISMWKNK